MTLPQVNKRNKNIQTALKKHLFDTAARINPHIHPTYNHAGDHPGIKLHQNCNLSLFMHIFCFCLFGGGSVCCWWLLFWLCFSPRRPLTKNHRSSVKPLAFTWQFGSIGLTWNSVNRTSLCVYMRVYERQGVSVSSGWFSCHSSSFFLNPESQVSLRLLCVKRG